MVTLLLALLTFAGLKKSLWKHLGFVLTTVLAAFLLFAHSLTICDVKEQCAGSGLALVFIGTPLFLINVSVVVLLTFVLAVIPARNHGFLSRAISTLKVAPGDHRKTND